MQLGSTLYRSVILQSLATCIRAENVKVYTYIYIYNITYTVQLKYKIVNEKVQYVFEGEVSYNLIVLFPSLSNVLYTLFVTTKFSQPRINMLLSVLP